MTIGDSTKLADRILRDSEVREMTGVSRTTRWRWVKEGTFPKPRQIGANSIGWLESEVLEWLRNLPQIDGENDSNA